jgi:hypothetical protein
MCKLMTKNEIMDNIKIGFQGWIVSMESWSN